MAASLFAVNHRATAALLAAALAAPLLAACGEKEEPATTGPVVAETTTGPATTPNGGGGGGGGQPATDEERIRATITQFLTKPGNLEEPASAAVCDELLTERFLRQTYGSRKNCIESRMPGALADQATILGRKPGRGGATVVTVEPRGGVFGGQTLRVTVVEAGGAWKIDEISGNAKVGP
ncbi:MAG: hypothetical protein BroJett022_09240 [Actinomycetes bacterium]|nr:MAG: hypothetical protein BroJett022_09240 [Actinomycetes bacterium]